jgi:hypothetical protein
MQLKNEKMSSVFYLFFDSFYMKCYIKSQISIFG